ncbi:MAG: SMODS domain-containing nucleotidyltransferase [Acidimicrobiia bacterium]
MATLPTQFTKAKSNVEPERADKENAAAAHADVREHLEADATLKEHGIDTVLIGSYKRQVSIKRVKDVDVLSKLPDLPDDEDVNDLMDHLIAVLQDAYDEDGGDPRVAPQDSSIKVEFPDFDMHVDVVPARPAGNYLEIPDREGGWMETNPEELTSLSSKMNERYNDDYVPVVKLIRQTRRTHLGKRPGGLFFEILTYHAFDAGLDDSSLAALFTGALRSIATQLEAVVAGGDVDDPTRPGEVIKVRVTDAQMRNAAATFAELAQKAEDALANPETCPAARAYREILGKNDDGDWVFEMPATCNDDGTPKQVALITKGDRHVPAGDSRFA